MASTDYDWQSSRNKLITRAFRLIGGKSLGEQLNAEEINIGIEVLNDMVKSWQSERIFLWTLKAITQSLSASTTTYALAANPPVIGIERAFIRESGTDTPVTVLSWQDYWNIPNKADEGRPTHIALDNNKTPTLYVWLTPNATYTLYLLAVTTLEDWESSSGSEDFPPRWTDALVYGLAARLADEYKVPERAELWQRAELEFNKAAKGDRQMTTHEEIAPAFPVRCR